MATVSISAIAGVVAPVVGAAPVSAITECGEYTGTVEWFPRVHGAFKPGVIYTAKIIMTAKSGYTFVGVAANFFTVAGATPRSNADSNEAEAIFPESVVAVIDEDNVLGVAVPRYGDAPSAVLPDSQQYSASIVWSPDHSRFKAETVYTATITLVAKEGYTLTGVAEDFFLVSGSTATNSADSGVVEAVFPATGINTFVDLKPKALIDVKEFAAAAVNVDLAPGKPFILIDVTVNLSAAASEADELFLITSTSSDDAEVLEAFSDLSTLDAPEATSKVFRFDKKFYLSGDTIALDYANTDGLTIETIIRYELV